MNRCWLLLFLICALQSPAQKSELDSLRNILLEQPDDTVRVNLLLKTAWILRADDPQAAMKDAEEAKQLSLKLKFEKGQAMALSTIGVLYYRRGDLVAASSMHLQALYLRERIGDDNGVARSCINLGNIYSDQGNNLLALDYYTRAQEILEEGNDSERLGIVYLNIGGIYLAEGKDRLAQQYSTKTYQLAKSIQDPLLESQALNNAGVCYEHLQLYDSAMWAYRESYSIAEQNGEKTMMVDAGINIGNIHRIRKQNNEAVEFHRATIIIAEDMGYVEGLRGLYESLSADYEAMNDFKHAYECHVLFKKFSDSIYNEENSIRMLEIMDRVNQEKRQMEQERMDVQAGGIETRERARHMSIIFGGIAAVVILIAGTAILTLWRQRKRDRLLIEAQQNISSFRTNE